MKQDVALEPQDALLVYHTGRIAYAPWDRVGSRFCLPRALDINPYLDPFTPKSAGALLAWIGRLP